MCSFLQGQNLPCSLPFLSAWHAVDTQRDVGLTAEALGDEVFLFCFVFYWAGAPRLSPDLVLIELLCYLCPEQQQTLSSPSLDG